MSDFEIGDKVLCVNDKYEDGQQLIHIKIRKVYEITGEYFGTVRLKGCSLFFANWHFERYLEEKE